MCGMTTTLNPYLSFRNTAREAIEFYQSVLGGDLTITTFAEFGASESDAEAQLVMHSELRAPGGLVLMASDTPASMELSVGNNVGVSLFGDDEATLTAAFEKLSDGATIEQPLTAAPWGDTFGMLTDRFGIHWLVNITAPGA